MDRSYRDNEQKAVNKILGTVKSFAWAVANGKLGYAADLWQLIYESCDDLGAMIVEADLDKAMEAIDD